MSQTHEDAVKFEGEDASSGYASPLLDLIAAAFLILLSIIIMAASVALPMPGDLVTAPGLLPFITSGSLLIMALILGYTAIKRRRAGVTGHTDAIELSDKVGCELTFFYAADDFDCQLYRSTLANNENE